MEYERRAVRITHISPNLVPGLLQTRGYARSIMISGNMPPDDADQRTDVRIARQQVLVGRRPVAFVAVIGEMALRYPPCHAEVMIEQLRHLLAMSQRPNIEIRLVPLALGRYSLALEGQFIFLELQRDNPVVHAESCRSVSMLTDQRTVGRYREAADTILADSMDAHETAKRVAEMASDLEAQA